MQLNKKPISQALAVATYTLLSNTPQQAEAQDNALSVDTSYLDYSETDRVKVREVDLGIGWQVNDDNVVTGKFIFDSITGATPSGALIPPKIKSATSSSASGNAGAVGYGVDTGNFLAPLGNFVDRRLGASGNIETTFHRVLKTNIGASISTEDDYLSLGTSASVGYDLNQRLTTLEAGVAVNWDRVSPAGGPPPEFGNLENTRYDYENGHKVIIDKSVGIVQVLNRRTVTKFTYTGGTVNGYLSDPYKVVTLTGTVVDQATNTSSREIKGYFWEKRPNSRRRNSINFDLVHQPKDADVIGFSYRYYWDDWKVVSHTFDLHYRYELGGKHYLQPHVRYYRQTAAYFYVPYLDDDIGQNPEIGDNPPTYASADYRLDKLTNTTIGLKYGYSGKFGHFRVRYDLMRQRGTHGDFKKLNARIIQVMWTLNFK